MANNWPTVTMWEGELEHDNETRVIQIDAPDGMNVRVNLNESTLHDRPIGGGDSMIDRSALAYYQTEMSQDPSQRRYDREEMIRFREELISLGFPAQTIDAGGYIYNESE